MWGRRGCCATCSLDPPLTQSQPMEERVNQLSVGWIWSVVGIRKGQQKVRWSNLEGGQPIKLLIFEASGHNKTIIYFDLPILWELGIYVKYWGWILIKRKLIAFGILTHRCTDYAPLEIYPRRLDFNKYALSNGVMMKTPEFQDCRVIDRPLLRLCGRRFKSSLLPYKLPSTCGRGETAVFLVYNQWWIYGEERLSGL